MLLFYLFMLLFINIHIYLSRLQDVIYLIYFFSFNVGAKIYIFLF